VNSTLKNAYANGDYNTIRAQNSIASNDLNPIYGNIQARSDGAFFQVTNPSDGVHYYLSIAGPANAPTAYMWSYVAPDFSVPAPANGETAVPQQPVAQFGTLSMNSSMLGISNQIWDNTYAQLTAGAIATIAMTTTSKFIQNRIKGMLTAEAEEAALGAAGEELVAEGVVEAATWVTITAAVGGLVVGAVVGAIVFFLIMFIINFVDKTYTLAVNINNWDLNAAYLVSLDYTDNAVIDGDTPFTPTQIPPPTSK